MQVACSYLEYSTQPMKMASDTMLFQSKLTFDTAWGSVELDVTFAADPPLNSDVNVGLHARSTPAHASR